MSYVTTGSSNTVNPGEPIHLNIRISRESSDFIFLTGKFTITGLKSIAEEEDLEEMVVTLHGKMADEDLEAVIDTSLGQKDDGDTQATTSIEITALDYSDINADRRYANLGFNEDEFTHIEIRLEGGIATATLPKMLRISFEDENNTDSSEHTIDFDIHIKQEELKILSFTADPLILQGDNDKQVTLRWAIEGRNYTYRLLKGLTELIPNKDSKYTMKPGVGDHVFTLEVTQGETIITKEVTVRVLRDSKLGELIIKEATIGNFCVSQDANFLFSLMLIKKDAKHAQIDHIGYTHQGFSEQWKSIALSEEDKEVLKPFATSPMIHLSGSGYGRLFFIGGSYVKPMETSNNVAIVDLNVKEGNKVRIASSPDPIWESRMGHSCVLFPHGDAEEKIWLLGGVDAYGNALNDVWVSGNGEEWINLNKKGEKETNNIPASMDWDPRCIAGITATLDTKGKKKALWFGGGFSEIGGEETGDLWRFENNNWTQIAANKDGEPLSINDGSYLSSGLGFIGRNESSSMGVALLGGDTGSKTYFFNKITILNSGFYKENEIEIKERTLAVFDTNNDAYVITAYFKGSLWFMVFTDEGDDGITYSRLHYLVPKKGKETLILL